MSKEMSSTTGIARRPKGKTQLGKTQLCYQYEAANRRVIKERSGFWWDAVPAKRIVLVSSGPSYGEGREIKGGPRWMPNVDDPSPPMIVPCDHVMARMGWKMRVER